MASQKARRPPSVDCSSSPTGLRANKRRFGNLLQQLAGADPPRHYSDTVDHTASFVHCTVISAPGFSTMLPLSRMCEPSLVPDRRSRKRGISPTPIRQFVDISVPEHARLRVSPLLEPSHRR